MDTLERCPNKLCKSFSVPYRRNGRVPFSSNRISYHCRSAFRDIVFLDVLVGALDPFFYVLGDQATSRRTFEYGTKSHCITFANVSLSRFPADPACLRTYLTYLNNYATYRFITVRDSWGCWQWEEFEFCGLIHSRPPSPMRPLEETCNAGSMRLQQLRYRY